MKKFHSYLLSQGYTINTARNLTLGIRQLFRFYEMPIRFRADSKVSKTTKTTRSFPLTIEHVRAMFKVADLRERIILSMATDLGLRIGDFIALKKSELPPLAFAKLQPMRARPFTELPPSEMSRPVHRLDQDLQRALATSESVAKEMLKAIFVID